jgi:hypothetical protein
MTTLICRPFITLRNGKILYAWEKGLKAFCFNVKEKQKTPPPIKENGASGKKKKL